MGVQAGQSVGEQFSNVFTRSLAGVPDEEDLADLGQREAGSATTADEVQAGEGLRREVAVAAGGAHGRGE